jgi:hypothetical protein
MLLSFISFHFNSSLIALHFTFFANMSVTL